MVVVFAGGVMPYACNSTGKVGNDGARKFVQQFLDWYVPKAHRDETGRLLKHTLTLKKSAFSPKLLNDLKEDIAAQSRVKGEIVGIDFDPFLYSQDIARSYAAGKVIVKGKDLCVEILLVDGKKSKLASTAVVQRVPGRWRFVTFVYGNNSNLIDILALLKRERDKAP